jgi:hypothetical protein
LRVKAAVAQCLRVLRAHRSRLVLVALAFAFTALLVWLSSPRPIEDDDASLPAVAAGAPSERPPDSLAAVSPEQAVLDPSQVAGGGAVEKVEVCGVGWVDADAEGAVDTEAILASAPMAEASARLLESVRGDGDYGAATALALQLAARREGTASLLGIELACGTGPCDATSQDRAAAASLFDQMAKLASATNDPRAYSLALQVCAWRRGEGPCAVLNAAQWARLEPDNGEPWLRLLDEAFARRDTSAIDDALFHIGAATRLDGRLLSESDLVARHAGTLPVDLFVAGDLSGGVGSLRAVGGFSGTVATTKACSGDALSEPNRKELCEKVATALQERSDSMMTMRIGSLVGRRLGWAEERFADADAIVAAQLDALPIVAPPFDSSRPAAALRGPLDCATIARVLRYVDQVATLGEREYLRRWIERSGKADEYLRRGRVQHARTVAREAAEAAQRASAPAR